MRCFMTSINILGYSTLKSSQDELNRPLFNSLSAPTRPCYLEFAAVGTSMQRYAYLSKKHGAVLLGH